MINEAMIFAAGLGKRMYPLTKDKPKPLIKIKNKSILKNNIEKLIQNNFKNIIVNAFHRPEQIMSEIKEFSSVKIIIEKERLETGGGLVNAINENYFEKNSPIILLNSDILSNIAYGLNENEIDQKKVWESIKAAQIEDLIYSLPKKLKTKVGENGIRLSGGQRQRIAIARAFYRNTKIIVMDEATSALDNKTESNLIKAISKLNVFVPKSITPTFPILNFV